MKFWFDLDGTLCKQREDGRYELAEPIWPRIREVNRLHAKGHYIGIHTARGQETGEDWMDRTEAQLRGWGVQFDELRPKPFADIYVDDRGSKPEEFFA